MTSVEPGLTDLYIYWDEVPDLSGHMIALFDCSDSASTYSHSECLTSRARIRQNGDIDKGHGGGCAAA